MLFLSCLYGSAHIGGGHVGFVVFLSCLYGSALLHINFNLLIFK
ncbi:MULTISPECIES: hypothetical protein [Photorhabdus]|nr:MULTISPECIES: hypothetical protein [Photorhabdus]